MKISTLQYSDIEWRLGICEQVVSEYIPYKKYIQRCCLKPQQHILTCINKKVPRGWGDGYIEIQGHRYCDDFMAYKLMQKVTIRSKNRNTKWCLK